MFSTAAAVIPTASVIDEMTYYAKRSIAKSIITIGSGIAADTAALVRLNIECGPSALKTPTSPNANPFMPLIHVPTQISTAYFLRHAMMSTDSVDVMIPIPVRSAEVISSNRMLVLIGNFN